MIERFKCVKCEKTPALADIYACGQIGRAKRPVFEYLDDKGFIIRYWNCPLNFIPKSIVEFNKEYSYIKDFNIQMPEIRYVSEKWLKVRNIYESKVQEYREEKG